MTFADGTYKKGLFENNVFIEEIIDEDEKEDEASILVEAKGDKNENQKHVKKRKKSKRQKPPTGE